MPEPLRKLVETWRDWARVNHDDFLDQALAVEHRADELEAALKACPSAREWLIGGGGGHEDGADGLRALTVSGEGLVEFLEAYRRDILGVRDE